MTGQCMKLEHHLDIRPHCTEQRTEATILSIIYNPIPRRSDPKKSVNAETVPGRL